LEGGAGNDILIGGSGADYIYGGEGDDLSEGGSGRDDMSDSVGNDILRGGADGDWMYDYYGNDTIEGGAGDDYIEGWRGAAGEGTNVFRGDAGDDIIYDGSGTDTLEGGTGDDLLEGSAGNDTLDGGNGNDRLSDNQGTNLIRGGAGDDTIELWSTDTTTTVYLGEGSDRVYQWQGSAFRTDYRGSVTIMDFAAGVGGDMIELVADNSSSGPPLTQPVPYQLYLTQVGADVVLYQASLSGGAPVEMLRLANVDGQLLTTENFVNFPTWADWGLTTPIAVATDSDDTLVGFHDDDRIEGLGGNDILSGGQRGIDHLDGGAGDDRILALDHYLGSITMTGGTGRDRFEIDRSTSERIITDFSTGDGGDVVAVTGGAGTRIILVQAGPDTVVYLGDDATIDLAQIAPSVTLRNVNLAQLSPANFDGGVIEFINPVTTTGTSAGELIRGSFGDDVINGAGGPDTINGLSGDDHLTGDDGASAITVPPFSEQYAGLTNILVNGLGGTTGFGEQGLPRNDDSQYSYAIPADFNAGTISVAGTTVSSISISNNGRGYGSWQRHAEPGGQFNRYKPRLVRLRRR
jgi:Ca2+-binding RTX toxin-like protein